jgi:hypothetical protein
MALACAGGAAIEFTTGRDFAGAVLVIACLGMVYVLRRAWRTCTEPVPTKGR